MTFGKILGTGSYLPSSVMTNLDLEKRIDTSDEWITQRTGIRRRHVAMEETTSQMGLLAALQALQAANLKSSDLDMIIAASCTAEKVFPSLACLIQKELQIQCPAFDVQAACSGFIYGLSIADQYIKTGQAKHILVLGAESMSKCLDWEDRTTCVLFGDGAGAVVLGASDSPGILSTHLQADGRYEKLLYLNNPNQATDPYLRMSGREVFKLAVKYLGEIAEKAINASGLQPYEVDWIVPHQANIRIIQATAKKLNIPMERVIVTVDEHANTSAASIPIALDVAIKKGQIQKGQKLLLEAFGGGLTWGSALICY